MESVISISDVFNISIRVMYGHIKYHFEKKNILYTFFLHLCTYKEFMV